MTKVVIIGAGIVGSAIAYELSLIPGLEITLIEQDQNPASGATNAALGVLMGAISQKIKGRAWKLRQATMQRYETLIPELESLTEIKIPWNQQGIVMLGFENAELEKWQKLVVNRHKEGYKLEIWDQEQLTKQCPQVQNEQVLGALYSPCDRQVDPTILTNALIAGAIKNGVNCQFGFKVQNITATRRESSNLCHCNHIQVGGADLKADWLVMAAGLGTTPLTTDLAQPTAINPVLGQALELKLPENLGIEQFQPVITGNDVHIVPIGEGRYWVGATLEFPNHQGEIEINQVLLEDVKQCAIAYCPALAKAEIIRTWQGKRPRPEGQSAPVIGLLPGYDNILLATGHYRNGILLAPATALAIKEIICSKTNQF